MLHKFYHIFAKKERLYVFGSLRNCQLLTFPSWLGGLFAIQLLYLWQENKEGWL